MKKIGSPTEREPQQEGLSFKISPRLIDLFGRELVARTEAAVAELVKNAYDSDATQVHLKFQGVRNPGGSLMISDNGDGMSLQDLREKWMVIGTKDKLDHPRTRLKRRKVGEKGIGRLGAHKLSNSTILKTKKRGDANWIVLSIDWSKYYTDEFSFEEIAHPYRTEPGRTHDHGTTLILENLREGFSAENFERLQAELTLLVPPLPGIRDFKIEFESDEYPQFKGELKPSILKAANYILDAKYDGVGRLTGILKVKTESKERLVDTPVVASCGPLRVILYVYVLKSESFQGAPIQFSKIKQVLETFKGIRIYRDQFKVGIYGDQGDDWLGMDEEHIRFHEVVIHSKQVMGAVHITRDHNPNLIDTTNRDRLVANNSFFDLVSVIRTAVSEVNNQRWREREARDEARAHRKSIIDRAFDQIEHATEKDFFVPQDVKQEIGKAVDRVRQAYRDHVVKLEDELQMYRNLASLGISTAAFAHETEAVGLDLDLYLKEFEDRLYEQRDEVKNKLVPPFKKVWEAGTRSAQLVDLLLDFVRQRKQQEGPVSIPDLINELIKRYEPFLDRVRVKTSIKAQPGVPNLYCTPMDLEAVFINLLTNAMWAMREQAKREIHFNIETAPRKIIITVSDTGTGIDPAISEDIFIPFFTTKGPKGIGLGLTIVKDTLKKYHAEIKPIIPGLLKGATFEITIPLEKDGEHL